MSELSYEVIMRGSSRSFDQDSAFVQNSRQAGGVLVLAGDQLDLPEGWEDRTAVLVELTTECLEVHLPDHGPGRIFGFARWRLGRSGPTDHVEVVRSADASPDALAAVRAVLTEQGFSVSVSEDRAGRIVDRLIRPQFNLAMRAVDDGLATAEDLDTILTSGLGYRRGLLAPVVDGGLEHHHEVTSRLFEVYGQVAYAPSRRASVARERALRKGDLG